MKRLLALTLASIMMLSMIACGQTEPTTPDVSGEQTATATAHGFGGELTVSVSLSGDKITDFEATSHAETPVIMTRTLPILKERVLETNSVEVDVVSAATYTSTAILNAVDSAVKDAGVTLNSTEFKRTPVEDFTTDVLVVGGGPSGLAAAITAKETNPELDVTIIEKLDILSGNGKFDLNFYDTFNSEAQQSNGIEDSIEKFIEDKQNAGETPERLQVWAETANTVDAWLRGYGVELDYNYGGRNHMATEDLYAGPEIQDNLEKAAIELGINIVTGTAGKDVIMEDGKVIGILAEHDGNDVTITSTATILATGGFSYNKELLEEYAPGHEVLNTSNQMGATGDFVPVFIENDFKLHNMDVIRVIPAILEPSRDLTNSSRGLFFVKEDGNRFIDETTGELEMGLALIDGDSWMIFDELKIELHANIRKQYKEGKFVEADSITELAEKIGVNAENLEATLNTYNENAVAQVEDEFGYVAPRPLEEGKYYATKVESGVHMTKGGVLTNEFCQILTNDDTPVEGLYGSGEVTWQSGGYSQSTVFGMAAGKNAAEFASAK